MNFVRQGRGGEKGESVGRYVNRELGSAHFRRAPSVTRDRRKIATALFGGETISLRRGAVEYPRNARPRRIESALPNGTQIQ